MKYILALTVAVSALVFFDWTSASPTTSVPVTDENIIGRWTTFKQQYGKRYSTSEDSRRMQIFADNLARIQLHNSDPNRTYDMGINEFTDMTPQELAKRLGAVEVEPETTTHVSRTRTASLDTSEELNEPLTTAAGGSGAGARKKRQIIVTGGPMGAKQTITNVQTTSTTATGTTTTRPASTTAPATTTRPATTNTRPATTTTRPATTTTRPATTTTRPATTTTRPATTTTRPSTTTTTRPPTTTTTTRPASTTTTTRPASTTTRRSTTTSSRAPFVTRRNGNIIYYYYYYYGTTVPTTTTTTVAPPTEWDWTTASPPVVSPPKNQGSCGSCWAFAAVGVIEGQVALKTGTLKDYSEQMFTDCSTSNSGCNGGNVFLAIRDFDTKGVESETNYPYTGSSTSSCAYTANVAKADLPYNMTPRMEFVTEHDLMTYLYSVGPVSVSYHVAAPFYAYSSGVFSTACPAGSTVNHGVLLVGYGTDPVHGDYWKCKNSWGAAWGEVGYFRIKRNAGHICGFGDRAYFGTLS